MKHELSNKKTFVYSIALYLFLFITELAVNLLSIIKKYSKGKVTSTFFSKVHECINLLKFDIIIYILSLIFIYFIFSFINYKYVIWSHQSLKKRISSHSGVIKACLFIGINIYFILSLYLINYVNYPSSNITQFFWFPINNDNYHSLKILGYFLIFIYFLFFFYLSMKHAKKSLKILIWGFLGIILISYSHPSVHLKNLYYSLFCDDNNKGVNIIIIGIDSLNPKHTGYSNYIVNPTPNLDNLLNETIVFKNCYTPLARTFPSWYSILTGQYPKTNGVRYNLINRKFINPNSKTIGNILKDKKNYYTAHFTDETQFSNILKEDGFQYLRHPLIGVKDFLFGKIHDFSITNVFFNNPLGYKLFDFLDINRAVYHLYKSEYFTDELTSFLNFLKTKEKFFLAVHFCAPHWPYTSSSPYPFLYSQKPDHLFSKYDGALKMADNQLGKLMNAIKKKNIYDNSIIVILSDHGEALGGHGTNLRESDQNHMLLAIKLPHKKEYFEVNEFVRSIDIIPTLIDLIGGNIENYEFDGMSLKPLIKRSKFSFKSSIIMETGFSLDAPGGIGLELQELINEGINFYEFDKRGRITVKEEFHKELIKRKQRAVQTLNWKLILQPLLRKNMEKYDISLYDLIEDPECKNDVSEDYPDIYDKLLNKLIEHYKEEITQ